MWVIRQMWSSTCGAQLCTWGFSSILSRSSTASFMSVGTARMSMWWSTRNDTSWNTRTASSSVSSRDRNTACWKVPSTCNAHCQMHVFGQGMAARRYVNRVATHNNETVKWLSPLPIFMWESFWWWQCSNRYMVSLFPHLHTLFPSFSPSLISLMVSVDVKHHVYFVELLTLHTHTHTHTHTNMNTHTSYKLYNTWKEADSASHNTKSEIL